ncbi:hypothetical protein BaRGS_00040553, partial [Batillaria attramentaria]
GPAWSCAIGNLFGFTDTYLCEQRERENHLVKSRPQLKSRMLCMLCIFTIDRKDWVTGKAD